MDHYVESETGDFRLIYTIEKFRWAACSPGYNKEFHTLIRSTKNGKIMAVNL
jgi:glycylpeptide N-tetradecanoyltransferase